MPLVQNAGNAAYLACVTRTQGRGFPSFPAACSAPSIRSAHSGRRSHRRCRSPPRPSPSIRSAYVGRRGEESRLLRQGAFHTQGEPQATGRKRPPAPGSLPRICAGHEGGVCPEGDGGEAIEEDEDSLPLARHMPRRGNTGRPQKPRSPTLLRACATGREDAGHGGCGQGESLSRARGMQGEAGKTMGPRETPPPPPFTPGNGVNVRKRLLVGSPCFLGRLPTGCQPQQNHPPPQRHAQPTPPPSGPPVPPLCPAAPLLPPPPRQETGLSPHPRDGHPHDSPKTLGNPNAAGTMLHSEKPQPKTLPPPPTPDVIQKKSPKKDNLRSCNYWKRGYGIPGNTIFRLVFPGFSFPCVVKGF